MIKKILLSVGVFLLCASIVFPLLITFACLPPQYSRTFFGELDEKYERLTSVDSPRLVIVGGSSVAFGYDSAQMEELLGMPVVNFGLYADLGTKIMLDLSIDRIRSGDVVLLAPELDEQTLSLFFNGNSVLKAMDDRPSLFFGIDGGDFESAWGGLWQYSADKLKYLREGAPDPEGIYNSASFNEYGDIKTGLRPENTMTGGYDDQKTVSLTPSIYSADFVAYLNDYIKAARKKGAEVYYTFCPVNTLSLDITSAPEEIRGSSAEVLAQLCNEAPRNVEAAIACLSEGLLAYLREALDCPVIGAPADFVMGRSLFYDSNFHLNDAGVPLHTAHVAAALKAARGDTSDATAAALSGALDEIRLSRLPEWLDDGFRYAATADGGCTITGATRAKQAENTLEIPAASKGIPVTALTAAALDGCGSRILVFGPDGTALAAADGATDGMADLEIVCFYGEMPAAFSDRDGLLYVVAADQLAAYETSPLFSAAYADGRILSDEDTCLYENIFKTASYARIKAAFRQHRPNEPQT